MGDSKLTRLSKEAQKICLDAHGKVRPDVLQMLFDYNPETGLITHKITPEILVDLGAYSNHGRNIRDSKCAGLPAFEAVSKGYLCGGVFGVMLKAHNVAYAMSYGAYVEAGKEIDHIDGVKTNNSIANLRAVSNADNQKNKGLYKANKSGKPGVIFVERKNKWRAQIGLGGECVFLGYFEKFSDALLAREVAEKDADYHKNHGRAV